MTPPAPEKTPPTKSRTEDRPLALYIHWPFCVSKCPYCDFNSHVAETVDHDRWRSALLRELACFAEETKGRRLTSLFFGGGTPSLMAPETAAVLIEAAGRHWTLAEDIEITLEANPSSSETSRFQAFRQAGVNRLSLGVQSFDDQQLAFLGRAHNAREARQALEMAALTFPRFSFDLIYSLADETVADWQQRLAAALPLAGGHLSLYQLTIEPGTDFYRNNVQGADEDRGASLYETTQNILEDAGLPAYEISNHARPGDQSRHNLTYWQGGDYIGVGPGAHGRLTAAGGTEAVYQIHRPERWLEAVEADGHATAKRLPLTSGERRRELVMMGLRLRGGIERDGFHGLTGQQPEQAVNEAKLTLYRDEGWMEVDEKGLRATAAGRLRLNGLLAGLLD